MARNWILVSFGKSFFTPAGKQAAGNLAWMLAGRVISQVCLVGVILLLTRALGREQFGIFATALALQGYIVLLATAGMPAVVVREAVRRPGEVTRIASTFLAVAWTVGLFAALILSAPRRPRRSFPPIIYFPPDEERIQEPLCRKELASDIGKACAE